MCYIQNKHSSVLTTKESSREYCIQIFQWCVCLIFARVAELQRGKKENLATLSADINEQPLPLPHYYTMAIKKVLLKRPKQIWHVV